MSIRSFRPSFATLATLIALLLVLSIPLPADAQSGFFSKILKSLKGKRTTAKPPSLLSSEKGGLGWVVPIEEVQRRIDGRVQRGELVASEKPLTNLAFCQPPVPPKGCVPPIDLYREILPDIDSFISLVWNRVIQRKQDLPFDKNKPDDAVAVFFNFGCRQIARRMPGYAKIRLVVRKPGVGTSGDWDEKIDKSSANDEAVAEVLGTGSGKKGATGSKSAGGPPAYKPPVRDEVVEVCTVSHPQLEETLKKDIALLVKPRLAKPHVLLLGDPESIQGTGDPFNRDLASREVGNIGALIKLSDGKDLNALRPLRLDLACGEVGGIFVRKGFFNNAFCNKRGAPIGKAPINLNLTFVCSRHSGLKERLRLVPAKALDGSTMCGIPLMTKMFHVGQYLRDTDIGKTARIKHLEGETFNTIAKRLTGFYVKGGKARTFAIGTERHAREVKIDESAVPKSGDAERDMGEAAKKQNESSGKRVSREGLSKQVDQWTDAWEYTQILHRINTDPSFKATENIPERYKKVEAITVHDFWTRCEELWDICQNPVLPVEKEACVRCAFDAVLTKCIDGRKPDDSRRCPGVAKSPKYTSEWCSKPKQPWTHFQHWRPSSVTSQTRMFAIPGMRRVVEVTIPGRYDSTFFNWLVVNSIATSECDYLTHGYTRKDRDAAIDVVMRGVATRFFLPFGAGGIDHYLSSVGRRQLDSLPLTPWQKCYLWTGESRTSCDLLDSPQLSGTDEIKNRVYTWMATRRSNSPLLQLVIADAQMRASLDKGFDFYEKCYRGGKFPCIGDYPHKRRTHYWFERLNYWIGDLGAQAGFPAESNTGEIGTSAGSALTPIIGYLFGILMNQAGISDMMKTLANAAGITPEQAVDCEDPEYRHDVMKLAGKLDNKRGCLTKVFAKNFVNSLEGIIIMLGNRLVDWAVDLLNQAMKGAKIALISAAGSVPFAGGVLAAAVEIAWDLIFEFGIKALIMALVVNKLPDWLQVKKLASEPLDKILEHPLISVVAGVILQLIEAAVQYGNMGPAGVAFAQALEIIQAYLMANYEKNQFWVRAFIHAKRVLLKDKDAKENPDLKTQIKKLFLALIDGFKETVGARIRTDYGKKAFDKAVGSVTGLAKGFDILRGDPIKGITKTLAEKMFPAVIPLITTFVPKMPAAARDILDELGRYIYCRTKPTPSDAFCTEKELSVTAIVKPVKALLASAVSSEPAARALFETVFDNVAGMLNNIDGLRGTLNKPEALVVKLIGPVRDAATAYVATRFGSKEQKTAGELVKAVTGQVFDLLLDEKKRAKFLGTKVPTVKEFWPKVVEFLKPHAKTWLNDLLNKSGLPQLGVIAELLFAPDGPLVMGKVFNAQKWLEKNGAAAFNRIVGQFINLVKAKIDEAVKDAKSTLVNRANAAFANTLVATLQKILTTPEERAKLATLNGPAFLKWAKAQLQPFVDKLLADLEKVPGGPCAGGKPFADNVRAVLNAFFALLDNPEALKADAARIWQGFVAKVDKNLRALATCAFSNLGKPPDIAAFVAKLTFEPLAVARIVIQILDPYWGSGPFGDLMRFLVHGAFDLFATPGKLAAILAKSACSMFGEEIGPRLKSVFPLVVKIYVSQTALIPIASKAFELFVDVTGKLFCMTGGGSSSSSSGGGGWWLALRDFFLAFWPDFNLKFLKPSFDLRFPDFDFLWSAWDKLFNFSFDLFGGKATKSGKGGDLSFDLDFSLKFPKFFGSLSGGFWDWLAGLFSGGGGGGGSSWNWPELFFGGLKGWSSDWLSFSLGWSKGGGSGGGGGGACGAIASFLGHFASTLDTVLKSTVSKADKKTVLTMLDIKPPFDGVIKMVPAALTLFAKNLCTFTLSKKCDPRTELVRKVAIDLLGKLAVGMSPTIKGVVEEAIVFAGKDEKFTQSSKVCKP